jgi:hypothetical protein
MLSRATRILVTVFALALLAAQSLPPSPPKGTQGKRQQGSPKEPQINSEDGQSKSGVTIVNQLYPQPEKRNVAEGKEDKNQSAFTDTLTAFSTLLLAIFTLLLAVATGALCYVAWLQLEIMKAHKKALDAMAGHMESGLAETRKTADAATKSANVAEIALKLSHRADVLLTKVTSSTGRELHTHTVITLWIKNYGRTRADRVFVNVVLGTGPLNPTSENMDHARLVIAPGEELQRPFPQLSESIPESVQAVLNGQAQLGFGGWISYVDAFNTEHVYHCEGMYSLELHPW